MPIVLFLSYRITPQIKHFKQENTYNEFMTELTLCYALGILDHLPVGDK